MAIAYCYINRDDFKDRYLANQGTADTLDNTKIDIVLQNCTRIIDELAGRTFRTYLATLYFASSYGDLLQLDEDLLSITTLKTDEDGDLTYEVTWASTDYVLEPYNAPIFERAYTQIRIAPLGARGFTQGTKSIEINGKWGYSDITKSGGTLGAAISDTTGTSVTMAAGHSVKPLHTLLIDTEQLFVTVVSTNTLTVKRATNGTTAATHTNSTAVNVYEYPAGVQEAAYLLGGRMFKRKDVPFGIMGAGDMGQVIAVARKDPDINMCLDVVSRKLVGAF